MEEKTTQPANATAEAPKMEINPQVQAILKQTEGRMQQLMENLKQMHQMLTDKTIDQLFEVLKYAVHFDPDFVEKSAKCIETYLTNVAFSNTEEPAQVEEPNEEA